MRKEQLIKYFQNSLTEKEQQQVFEWLERDPRNMDYFTSLHSLWLLQSMPRDRAESPGELSMLAGIVSHGGKRKQGLALRRTAIRAAVAALVLLGALNVWFLADRLLHPAPSQDGRIVLSHLPEAYRHEIYTEKGVKAVVTLPDSSRVILNCDTRIVFPDRFVGPTREVFISGEGFFEVSKDSLRPMVVTTPRDMRIEVVGTTFNIRSYEDEPEAQATLLSGRINLIHKTGRRNRETVTVLRPHDSYILRADNRLIASIDAQATSKETAWKEGRLIFEQTSVKDMIARLERWHGTNFIVQDPEILDYRITGTFHNESIVQIMEMIKFTSMIDYSAMDNTVILSRKHK